MQKKSKPSPFNKQISEVYGNVMNKGELVKNSASCCLVVNGITMINQRILGLVLSSGTVQLQGEYFGRLPSYTI